jgi:hypothetical protein
LQKGSFHYIFEPKTKQENEYIEENNYAPDGHRHDGTCGL